MIGLYWWINHTCLKAGMPRKRHLHTNTTGAVERTVRLEKDAAIGTTAVVNTEGTRMEDVGTRQRMVMMGSTVTTILTGPEKLMMMALMEQKVMEI